MASRKQCYAQLKATLERTESGYRGPSDYIHWPDDKRELLPGFPGQHEGRKLRDWAPLKPERRQRGLFD